MDKTTSKIQVGDEVVLIPTNEICILASYLGNNMVIVCGAGGSKTVCLDSVKKYVEPVPPLPEPKGEELNSPKRYKAGKFECMEVAAAIINEKKMNGEEAISTFNGIKYWWRWKDKTPRASLKKSIVYAQKMLDYIEKHPDQYPEG